MNEFFETSILQVNGKETGAEYWGSDQIAKIIGLTFLLYKSLSFPKKHQLHQIFETEVKP